MNILTYATENLKAKRGEISQPMKKGMQMRFSNKSLGFFSFTDCKNITRQIARPVGESIKCMSNTDKKGEGQKKNNKYTKIW